MSKIKGKIYFFIKASSCLMIKLHEWHLCLSIEAVQSALETEFSAYEAFIYSFTVICGKFRKRCIIFCRKSSTAWESYRLYFIWIENCQLVRTFTQSDFMKWLKSMQLEKKNHFSDIEVSRFGNERLQAKYQKSCNIKDVSFSFTFGKGKLCFL